MKRNRSKNFRFSNKLFLVILLLVAVFATLYAIQKQTNLFGQAAAQKNEYKFQLLTPESNFRPGKPVKLQYQIRNRNGEAVKFFPLMHQEMMHLVLVRHDLQHFQHLHPDLDMESGTFTQEVIFPEAGPFRMFAEFMQGGMEVGLMGSTSSMQPQEIVLSKNVQAGSWSGYKPQPIMPDTEMSKSYGPYEVMFHFPEELVSDAAVNYSLAVMRNGSSVTDLEPYLGEKGHSIILRKGSLDFIHVHAMDGTMDMENTPMSPGSPQPKTNQGNTGNNMMMKSMPKVRGSVNMPAASPMTDMMSLYFGPEINFWTMFPKEGVYKIFSQFKHKGKVVTTDYTVEVD